jgi:hypothetical protein
VLLSETTAASVPLGSILVWSRLSSKVEPGGMAFEAKTPLRVEEE